MDVSVNSDERVDSDAILDDAAEASLAEAAEGREVNSPFVDVVAAEPELEGLDKDAEIERQDLGNDNDDSAATSSEADSDAATTSTVVSEEPDWLEVGNSLLAMSQSERAPEASTETSDSTETAGTVETPEEARPAPSSSEAPMSPLLERIVAMGFSDTEKVRAALVASDGDIEAAVAVLIAGQ